MTIGLGTDIVLWVYFPFGSELPKQGQLGRCVGGIPPPFNWRRGKERGVTPPHAQVLSASPIIGKLGW